MVIIKYMWGGIRGASLTKSKIQRYKALAKRKHSCSNLHESAGLGEEVVDGVAGHPPDVDNKNKNKKPGTHIIDANEKQRPRPSAHPGYS